MLTYCFWLVIIMNQTEILLYIKQWSICWHIIYFTSYCEKHSMTKWYILLYLEGPIHLNFSQSYIISPNNPNPSTKAEYDSNCSPSWTLTILDSTWLPSRTWRTAVRAQRVPWRCWTMTSPDPEIYKSALCRYV